MRQPRRLIAGLDAATTTEIVALWNEGKAAAQIGAKYDLSADQIYRVVYKSCLPLTPRRERYVNVGKKYPNKAPSSRTEPYLARERNLAAAARKDSEAFIKALQEFHASKRTSRIKSTRFLKLAELSRQWQERYG